MNTRDLKRKTTLKTIFLLCVILMVALCLCLTSVKAYADTTTSKYTGITYTHSSQLDDYIVANGVDISNWQEDVDWARIKADGIDFAIIRAGGRGYSSTGTIYKDERFVKNIQAAKQNGIMVGVYFFSQAKTVKEAQKEVDKCVSMMELAGYDASDLDLPLFMDYEMAGDSKTGRLYGMTKTERTEVAEAWLEYAESKGYTPGIYTDLNFSSRRVNGAQLSEMCFYWAAQYYTLNQFPFDYTWWQYSSSGKVDSVLGGTDMNFWYINKNNTSSLDAGAQVTLRQRSGFAFTPADIEGTAAYSIADSGVDFTGESTFTYGSSTKFEPAVQVIYAGRELTLGTDYKVRYIGNTQAGTAYALVIGQGEYTDYKAIPFKIKSAKYSGNLTFSEIADQKYTGNPIEPAITITDPTGKVLTNGTDYVVSYENNVNVGTASVIINFSGNYKGAHEIPFNIVKATQKITINDMRTETVLQDGSYELGVSVKFDTTITYKSSDPTVAEVSETGVVTPLKAGVTTLTIRGLTNDNFKSIKRVIELTVIDPEAPAEEPIPEEPGENGENTEPGTEEGTDPNAPTDPSEGSEPTDPSAPEEGGEQTEPVDGGDQTDPNTPADNTEPTEPEGGADNAGDGENADDPAGTEPTEQPEETEPAKVTRVSIKGAKVQSISSKIWTGRLKKPAPYVKVNGKKLVRNKDYKITYKDNLNVGRCKVTIKGIGNYKGSITKYFKIIPKKTKISKLTATKTTVTVNWKKLSTKMSEYRITGYQVQRATNKTFTKNKKTIKILGYKKTSCKFTKLKTKKTYYFRIRTYVKIGDKTFYSKWSGWKKIQTKPKNS